MTRFDCFDSLCLVKSHTHTDTRIWGHTNLGSPPRGNFLDFYFHFRKKAEIKRGNRRGRSDRGRKERSSQELRTESNTQFNFTLLTLTRAASPTVFSLQAHSSYANSFVLLPASLSEGECTTETLYPPGWLAVSVELRGIETSRVWCADTGESTREFGEH